MPDEIDPGRLGRLIAQQDDFETQHGMTRDAYLADRSDGVIVIVTLPLDPWAADQEVDSVIVTTAPPVELEPCQRAYSGKVDGTPLVRWFPPGEPTATEALWAVAAQRMTIDPRPGGER